MEVKTVKSILKELQYSQQQANYSDELYPLDLTRDYSEDGMDARTLLNCYLELFNWSYANGKIQDAKNYYNLSSTLIEHYGQWNEYVKFMDSTVKASIFSIKRNEVRDFIENLIPKAFAEKQYEVLSHCYTTLSCIHLEEQQFKRAIQEAKMAHFYAEKLPSEQNKFVLCNAQLQLTFALIEHELLNEAEVYLKNFNWTYENCENDSERIFVQVIYAILNCLKGEHEQGAQTFIHVLTALTQSKEVMYSTILTRQIQAVIAKRETLLDVQVCEQIKELCTTVLNRNACDQQVNHIGHSHYFSRNPLEEDLVNPTKLFERGQALFDRAQAENLVMSCLILEANVTKFPNVEKALLRRRLEEVKHLITPDQYLLCQYNATVFIVVAIVPQSHMEPLLVAFNESLMGSFELVNLNWQLGKAEIRNFHECFSMAALKRLQTMKTELFI